MANVNDLIDRSATDNMAQLFNIPEDRAMKIVETLIAGAKRILLNAQADKDAPISNISIVFDLTSALNDMTDLNDREMAYAFYQIGYYERVVIGYLTPTHAD